MASYHTVTVPVKARTGRGRTGRGRLAAIVAERRELECWERAERWAALAARGRAAARPVVIRQMDRVSEAGEYDRTPGGLIRLRRGQVDGEWCICMVQCLDGDILIEFHSEVRRDHARRLLVTPAGERWLDVDGRAVPHSGKYALAAALILAARDHERGVA